MLHLVGIVAVALLLGGMVFFAAVVAPLVFTRLPAAEAGRFIRSVFPVYYLYVLATAALAAAALAPTRAAAVMAVVALATVWLRQWLMPRINRASDAAREGDARAKRRFDLGHRVSVVVNLAQIVAAGAVLATLASAAGA